MKIITSKMEKDMRAWNSEKVEENIEDAENIEQFNVLEDVVRIAYARAVWSHKIQEKQSDKYNKSYFNFSCLLIILNSAVTIGLVPELFDDMPCVRMLTLFVSFFTLVVTAYLNLFNFPKMASANKKSANDWLEIREQLLLLLINIRLKNKSFDDLLHTYEQLLMQIRQVCSSAADTTSAAVVKAEKALNGCRDDTFGDEEIDKFLPKNLRRS